MRGGDNQPGLPPPLKGTIIPHVLADKTIHRPSDCCNPTERATFLLAGTHFFDDLQIGGLAHLSRAVARDVLDLVADLDQERSARIAISSERDRLRVLLAERAGS